MKEKHFVKIILMVIVSFTIIFIISKIFFNVFLPSTEVSIQKYSDSDAFDILPLFISSIFITFSLIIYLFNSWFGKKWVYLDWSRVILFMGLMAGIGPTAEITGNTLWRIFTHESLWSYQLFPIHGGDTSLVMCLLWPLYGFHVYCFHTALKNRNDKTTDIDMAIFTGIDAITLEVLANIFCISFFYTYIFYYFAEDLNHLSTFLIFIPYVILGYIVVKILHLIENTRYRILFGIIGFLWGYLLIFVI